MEFEVNTVPKNPLELFDIWFKEVPALGYRENNSMTLSTVNSEGQPNSRVVLFKEITKEGLVFYTNYNSIKGEELSQNNKACVSFFWDQIGKQIKIFGTTTKTSRQTSEAYWNSRDRNSQISQYASRQSSQVGSRKELLDAWHSAEKEWEQKDIPCPEHWGGYVFTPNYFEFWQADKNRFHDRITYTKVNEAEWNISRISP